MLSRTDTLARRLRALRGDGALRESQRVFVAEGIHLAQEALAAGAAIEAAVVSPRLLTNEEGRDLALRLRAAGVNVYESSDATLDALQDARSPQPVVLIVRREPASLQAVAAGRGGTPLLVVACGVQEPGNVGALLRTADAAGATGFVTTPGSASLTHPRAVRASMGAIFRLPAVEAPLIDVLEEVHSRQFTVIGADARGVVDQDSADWRGALALFLGGEGAGLPPPVAERIDQRVAIPMAPGVESLSVTAAAAVLLFAAAGQRRAINRA
jgi:RNA methyltransferase, TrmH family